jgi:orotate phosphoribosyltransferase-like protein
MNNRERLITLITDNGLDRSEVAELLRIKRDQVDHWLVANESKHHEEVPDMAIELLELKLKIMKQASPEN